MKHTMIALLILIVSIANVLAQNKWQITTGINCSTVRGDETILKIGYTAGFEREWTVAPKRTLGLALLYNVKKGMITNIVTAHIGSYPRVSLTDKLLYSVGSLEIPFFLRQYFPLKGTKPYIMSGLSFSLGLNDKTAHLGRVRIYIDDLPAERRWVNYWATEMDKSDRIIRNSGIGLYGGAGIQLNRLGFEARYFLTLYKYDYVSNFAFGEKVDSFQVLLKYQF